MTNNNDGIFTQHGPDGIFGRGGEPGDASAPTVDSDGTPLHETLIVAYPSPGHMRVARATRHPKSGRVEFQEEYRMPTPEEVALLAQKGVSAGAGSMMNPPAAVGMFGSGRGVGEVTPPAPEEDKSIFDQPWLKIAGGVAVGVAGFWVAQKWVMPWFAARSAAKAGGDDDYDDGADDGADD